MSCNGGWEGPRLAAHSSFIKTFVDFCKTLLNSGNTELSFDFSGANLDVHHSTCIGLFLIQVSWGMNE